MSIFKRFQRQPQPQPQPQPSVLPAVGGYIAYYGLTDWWLTTFTSEDREAIAYMYATVGRDPLPLADGSITHAPLTAADFLIRLAGCVSGQDGFLGDLIQAKGVALGGEPHPGYLNGRLYNDYGEDVRRLKACG